MTPDNSIYEPDIDNNPDPDSTPIKDRKVVTQPYDLSIDAITGQINGDMLFLRPLDDRPNFQRQYVWTDKLASKLVESVLLNVPIPPCYLSQNDEHEYDVIDGQQRIYSIYRFIENQFKLSGLEALTEYNGLRFYELPSKAQRKFRSHTLRCVVITNESHPEIKFDVFERLNTNTVPLKPQELRNCIYRSSFNNLLGELSYDEKWLLIRGRKLPDKRLADEEMILRFFAFQILGLDTYRTPFKSWLGDAAKAGTKIPEAAIDDYRNTWHKTLEIVTILFSEPTEAFRRPDSKAINRALFDLVMFTASSTTIDQASNAKSKFRKQYNSLLRDEPFQDLISRSVDHRKRTNERFSIWKTTMEGVFT